MGKKRKIRIARGDSRRATNIINFETKPMEGGTPASEIRMVENKKRGKDLELIFSRTFKVE